MLDSIEPYDTSRLVQYKPEYLAGFTAERYSIQPKNAWETAREKMDSILRQTASSQIQQRHGSSLTRIHFLNTSHSNVTYKYILLPVWMSSFQYGGRIYHFMINGQTGKVSGQSPISWIKVGIAFLAFLLLFAFIHFVMNADASVLAMASDLKMALSSILI